MRSIEIPLRQLLQNDPKLPAGVRLFPPLRSAVVYLRELTNDINGEATGNGRYLGTKSP